jgi:hypothetical protein
MLGRQLFTFSGSPSNCYKAKRTPLFVESLDIYLSLSLLDILGCCFVSLQLSCQELKRI